LEPDAVIELVGESLRANFNVQSIYVALLDRQTNELSFPYYFEDGRRIEWKGTMEFGQGMTSTVIGLRQPVLINEDWERRAAEYGALYPEGEPAKSSLGVPMASKHLQGMDSLLSTVQMPKGIPVATFAIGDAGAGNAALFAVAMLALEDAVLARKLTEFRNKQADAIKATKLPE
jgi:hypothetical protein